MNRKAAGKLTILPLCLMVVAIARPAAAQTCSDTACLVSAVDAANLDTSTKKHVINLVEGYTYNLSASLTVSSKIIISGNDSKITGTGLPYIFLVSGGRLTLNEVTLANATGAGIFNDGATVTLNSSVIRNCSNPSAFGGGGIFK